MCLNVRFTQGISSHSGWRAYHHFPMETNKQRTLSTICVLQHHFLNVWFSLRDFTSLHLGRITQSLPAANFNTPQTQLTHTHSLHTLFTRSLRLTSLSLSLSVSTQSVRLQTYPRRRNSKGAGAAARCRSSHSKRATCKSSSSHHHHHEATAVPTTEQAPPSLSVS